MRDIQCYTIQFCRAGDNYNTVWGSYSKRNDCWLGFWNSEERIGDYTWKTWQEVKEYFMKKTEEDDKGKKSTSLCIS